MADLKNNRLVNVFAAAKAQGKKTLLPFITAGYPNLDATLALLKEFESRGAKVCELGIPFSDPIADGPTIQASYTEALDAGINSKRIFEMVRQYRADGGKMALVAMVSYSIVYRHEVSHYLRDAAEVGIDGVIIPDLSLEEAPEVEEMASSAGLANILLIAPNSPASRQLEIARHCRGFIYFMSVAGITGERTGLPAATIAAVAELRKHTDTPICVGFGVSDAKMVKTVCEVADGAIVGSAIVHRITDHKSEAPKELARQVGEFVSGLLKPVL